MDSSQIITAIINGDADDNLDGVAAAVKDRRATASRAKFHTAKIGDRATLKNLRPKYLIGAPVTVVSKRQTRLGVEIDQAWLDVNVPGGKYAGEVGCTPDMLDFDNPPPKPEA